MSQIEVHNVSKTFKVAKRKAGIKGKSGKNQGWNRRNGCRWKRTAGTNGKGKERGTSEADGSKGTGTDSEGGAERISVINERLADRIVHLI